MSSATPVADARTPVQAPPDLVLANGLEGEHVDRFRSRVREVLERSVVPLVEEAEARRRFPPQAIRALGAERLFRERWAAPGHGDVGRSVLIAEELGRAAVGGIGVGISVHLEAATGILQRLAGNEYAREHLAGALDGTRVACVATSEQHVGSDLTAVQTRLEPAGSGSYRVQGRKWFVSPGARADFAIVLCRLSETGSGPLASPLALVLVPKEGIKIERVLSTTGMRSLETARVTIDARVPQEAILGRPETGLLGVSWGLTHERIAVAAQVLGGAELVIGVTTARLHKRRQFEMRLIEHQALRLRLADLAAQVTLALRGIRAAAASYSGNHRDALREAAGIKVTATRLAERVLSECIHMFGGGGYVEDECALGRLWRDIRIGRLGAGSDEMMWELVAGGLRADEEGYARLMGDGQ